MRIKMLTRKINEWMKKNKQLIKKKKIKLVKHNIKLRGGSLMQSPTFTRSSKFRNKFFRLISCYEIKNGQVKPKGGKTVESDVKMRKNADKNVNPKNKWMNEKKQNKQLVKKKTEKENKDRSLNRLSNIWFSCLERARRGVVVRPGQCVVARETK